MWRTVESNHADPALLIANPDVCRLPCAVFPAVPLPCRWRTSEWACGVTKKKEIHSMVRLPTLSLAGYALLFYPDRMPVEDVGVIVHIYFSLGW